MLGTHCPVAIQKYPRNTQELYFVNFTLQRCMHRKILLIISYMGRLHHGSMVETPARLRCLSHRWNLFVSSALDGSTALLHAHGSTARHLEDEKCLLDPRDGPMPLVKIHPLCKPFWSPALAVTPPQSPLHWHGHTLSSILTSAKTPKTFLYLAEGGCSRHNTLV